MLGPHQRQELVLQGGDVSPDLGWVELLVPAAKAVLDLFRDGPSASRNALRAWSRCHPVSSHNSSRTLALTARDDDRYRVAVAFVTALRWLIVSPMSEAQTSAGRHEVVVETYAGARW